MERRITICITNGLHARPAKQIVEQLEHMSLSRAEIVYAGVIGDLQSIIELLSLGVAHGETVLVATEGPDAKRALDFVESVLSPQNGEAIGKGGMDGC